MVAKGTKERTPFLSCTLLYRSHGVAVNSASTLLRVRTVLKTVHQRRFREEKRIFFWTRVVRKSKKSLSSHFSAVLGKIVDIVARFWGTIYFRKLMTYLNLVDQRSEQPYGILVNAKFICIGSQ
jgi:hypothetical protein